jgi:hypothetical protein
LTVLRRSGIALAFCILSALSSFAQSSPSPSLSTPQIPLRGFVPPYEILRTLRAAGFQPLAPPLREGTTYVVRALDYRGIPGLYGPYMPGPYAPAHYGRLASPAYPPPDDVEPGYGRPPYIGASEIPSGDRHSSGLGLVPLPRARPASLAAPMNEKPVARPDVATTAPAVPQTGSSSRPAKDAAVPAIND